MRKVYFFFLASIFLLSNMLYASTWAKAFGIIRRDTAIDAVQLADGSFLALFESNPTENPCCDTDPILVQLDANGNILRSKQLQAEHLDHPQDLALLANGNVLITGFMSPAGGGSSTGWAVSLDENLEIVWQRAFGNQETNLYSATASGDGGMVLVGSGSFPSGGAGWVVKLNAQGIIEWQKTIGNVIASSVFENSNGDFILQGPISNNDFWIAQVDASGNLIWAKRYSPTAISSPADIVQTSDGGFVSLGDFNNGSLTDIYLMKTGSDGTPAWFKTYGGEVRDTVSGEAGLSNIVANSNGSIVFSGTTESFGWGYGDFWVLEVDDQGTIQWQKSIGGLLQDELNFLIATNDSGYLAGGATSSFPTRPFFDAWFVKIDSSGNLDPSCQISFDTFADPVDSSVSVSDPGFTVTDTSATVSDPGFIAVDTLMFSDSQCQQPCPTIDLAPPNVPAGIVGTAYSVTISASGGIAPYTYSTTQGSLPDGLTLDSQTGEISGVPQSEGIFGFVVTATDANGCSGERIYAIDVTCPSIQISPSTLPDGEVGQTYNQQLSASGGTSPYVFTITNGALPAGLNLAPDGLIAGIPTTVENANFEVTVTDSFGCTSAASYSLTIQPTQTCLFCDDFNDGVLATNWTYPKGVWSESNGLLTSTPQRKAIAIATPVFSGCASCAVQARLRTGGGIGNRVWLLGWYLDSDNYVELMMKEESDKWVLKQHSGGVVVAKQKGLQIINPNTDYDAEISFDGTNFQVMINGQLLITMPKFGETSPTGTVGFQVKATTGSFDYIFVF